MPPQRPKNFAFIDGQNLYLGLKESAITLDFRRFRIYLRDRFHVAEAYYFIGYMPQNQALYAGLQRAGFISNSKKFPGIPPARPKATWMLT
jgi:hypothetical protein